MQLQSFLSSALESKVLLFGRSKSQGKSFRYPLNSRMGETQRGPVGIGEDNILASCWKWGAVGQLWFVCAYYPCTHTEALRKAAKFLRIFCSQQG